MQRHGLESEGRRVRELVWVLWCGVRREGGSWDCGSVCGALGLELQVAWSGRGVFVSGAGFVQEG